MGTHMLASRIMVSFPEEAEATICCSIDLLIFVERDCDTVLGVSAKWRFGRV